MATLAELATSPPTRLTPVRRHRWEPDTATAAKIRQARANGWTYEAIAEALAEEGHSVSGELVRRWLLGLRR